jgi:WD40 repeat protein
MSENSVDLVKTIKLHSTAISASCMSKEGMFLGAGGCDGASKIVSLRYFEIDSANRNHDFVVKGISFTSDSRYLVTGTPEMGVDILFNFKTEGDNRY